MTSTYRENLQPILLLRPVAPLGTCLHETRASHAAAENVLGVTAVCSCDRRGPAAIGSLLCGDGVSRLLGREKPGEDERQRESAKGSNLQNPCLQRWDIVVIGIEIDGLFQPAFGGSDVRLVKRDLGQHPCVSCL